MRYGISSINLKKTVQNDRSEMYMVRNGVHLTVMKRYAVHYRIVNNNNKKVLCFYKVNDKRYPTWNWLRRTHFDSIRLCSSSRVWNWRRVARNNILWIEIKFPFRSECKWYAEMKLCHRKTIIHVTVNCIHWCRVRFFFWCTKTVLIASFVGDALTYSTQNFPSHTDIHTLDT